MNEVIEQIPSTSEAAPVAKAPRVKPLTMHTCAKCGKQFPGTGKRGKPFKNCVECRKA